MNAMSGAQIAWVAGLLEGEGCFSVIVKTAPSGLEYPTFRVFCHMTDADVVERLFNVVGCGRFGGPYIPKEKHWKPFWRWNVHRKDDVAALCRAILPHMGQRRGEKIAEILRLYETTLPKPLEHGTRPCYTAGCRCPECRAVNNRRQRAYYSANPEKFAKYREDRRATLAERQ